MDITLVYFIYGLAFFSMGLSMLMEAGRSPLFVRARVLRPLAVFGFIHGAHEWLEMFLDKSDWLIFQYPLFVDWARIGILTISFTALALFGLRELQPQKRLDGRKAWYLWGGIVLYALIILLLTALVWAAHPDNARHADAMIRYLVAVPSAILAGLALQRNANLAQEQYKWSLPLHWAAWGFGLYALTQMVVPPIDFFPGSILNTQTFIAWTGLPIQIFRAVLAVIITLALLRAAQAADELRQRQFVMAQHERLLAVEQVQDELIKREAQRKELLAHIVIAQEDERARIARELHDETSQLLTAFSLHLATLQSLPDANIAEPLEHLQRLSRQMSKGIYSLIHDLRPAQLDDLGLTPALKNLIDDFEKRLDLSVDFMYAHEPRRLGTHLETVLFRVAQESLTNVARHAQVDEARIELSYDDQEVFLRVCDQGVGFELVENQLPPRSWGLAGMRERAESVGGRLILRSAPGEGTVVEVRAPLNKEESGGG